MLKKLNENNLNPLGTIDYDEVYLINKTVFLSDKMVLSRTCRSIHCLETKYITNLTYFVLHLALISTRVLGHLDTKFTFDRIC